MTEYTVIRSKRKTAVVEIRDDLQVIVRVPYYLSNALIQELIQKQEPLIDRKLAQMKGQLEKQRTEFGEEPPITAEEIRQLMDRALQKIPPRVEYYAGLMGLQYGRITIRNQVSRWGSCSEKGNLSFNCLLMLCPADVRDYVIVHELCHLREMNHSPRFWAEVEAVVPDYRLWRRWLRKYGSRLIIRMRKGSDA
ncbi:MAG: M48 family metallopeptidase [Firmicutes bacterium]|nr:M48 family metallopeptidase [Bacillota bacterium]